MSPVELQERLMQLLNDLAQANEQYIALYQDYIDKLNAYKLAYSTAYLTNKANMGKATVNEIEAKTYIDTQGAKLAVDIAEGLFKAHKEKIDAIKIEIDTIRSILSFQKSELDRTVD